VIECDGHRASMPDGTPREQWEDLVALHPSSFGWALACCRRDREEAHEVLQQVYWKVASGISAALARLPERQREVLHLAFYEDMSISDAAVIMGVTLGTARTHYERGKHALFIMLGDRRGDL
jgi:hypothetical protein